MSKKKEGTTEKVKEKADKLSIALRKNLQRRKVVKGNKKKLEIGDE